MTYRPLFASRFSGESIDLSIIPASHVTSISGTGLVHCAPAHGMEDYVAFKNLGMLPSTKAIVCHVDGAGTFTTEVGDIMDKPYADKLVGQPLLDGGSRAVVSLLKDMGSLVKISRFTHQYPYDWRTKLPVITTSVFNLLIVN